MEEVEAALCRKSHGSNPETPVKLGWDMMMQIQEISKRDDGTHPVIWDQVVEQGSITITKKEHKWLLYEHQKKNGCANNFPPVVASGPGKL